jgi:hypothetical protein
MNPTQPFTSPRARRHFVLDPLDLFWRSAGEPVFPTCARIHDFSGENGEDAPDERDGSSFAALTDLPVVTTLTR